MDTGKELLLSNLPTPWSFYCTHKYQIQNDIQGASYVLIKKSDLCLCSITAGSLYLHENIASCIDRTDIDTQMKLKYTINKAVYIYFPELVPDLDLKHEIILAKPRTSTLADPILLSASDTDVIRYHNGPIELPTVTESVKSHHPLFRTVGGKALSIDNVDDWITWKNKPMAFILMCSIISIICLAILLVLWILVYKLKLKMFQTLRSRIEATTPRIPSFITNTISRFRDSFRSRPKSRTTMTPHPRSSIPMKTFNQPPKRVPINKKVSVQDAIQRIEVLEAERNLMGIDNPTFDPPDPPSLPSASSALTSTA